MNDRQHSAVPLRIIAGIIGAVIVVMVVIIAMRWMTRAASPVDPITQPTRPTLDLAEAHELQRRAQLANGHLENLELAQADAILSEIAQKLPHEPLGVRNRAICRYLLLEQQKIEAAEVDAALAALRELEPDQPATYWLLGKAAAKSPTNGASVAVSHFERAAQLAPDSPIYWYEAYDAARAAPTDMSEAARRFLGEAYRLAPDNLFLLTDWLLAQAQAEDPAIGETLNRALEVFLPLRDTVLKRHNVDVLALVQESQQALAAGDWPKIVRNARIGMNVTRPHDFTQGDKRSLSPHALEFAVQRFSDEFTSAYPPTSSTTELIELAFRPFPAEQQPPVEGEVRDALLVDFDLDGRPELLVLQSHGLTVYRRQAPSLAWEVLTSVELSGNPRGLLAADLDRDRDYEVIKRVEAAANAPIESCFDADADVVVYGESGVILLRNVLAPDGQRSLEVVEQDASVHGITDVVTAILVDFDHDSNLDIVCSTRNGLVALLGQGDMTFMDVSRFSTIPEFGSPVTSLVAVDWDRDVDIDIIAVAANEAVGYLENLRHGNFRWRAFGDEFSPLRAARKLSVLESDANASWDVAGVGAAGLTLVQTRTPRPGVVQTQAVQALGDRPWTSVLAADFDNNGYQDLLVWNERAVSLWRGNPGGSFSELALIDQLPAQIAGCESGDIDGDGDLDLCIFGAEGLTLYSNEGGNQNHWLVIRAMGQVDNAGKANHHGIGSLIEIKSGPLYQAQVVARPVTHFGLGQEPNAAIIRFLWTNGVPQDQLEPTANQVICELMTLKGSCPYVYTWTGERFEFFTDCLWAAPIGLQLAEDVLAPSRSWEYLLIPGDRLRPRDGMYALQVTEELWEAAYFDEISLIAVDHPADVEVFSNEKVGPAEISQFRLHTVRQRHTPVAARDQRGRDVWETIRTRDGQFLRAFDKTIVPGLAEEHYLELDLGKLDSPQQVTLFLTGWIYPTDTSLNVALSRHPQFNGPRPPALFVPDKDGEWQEIQAFMGFPGGKTKTITVDLSQAFLSDDYRVRIVTTAEIYWDEVFFTVDESPAEVRLTKLDLAAADLHYRGFSRALPARPHAPETYNYDDVQTAAKWPPMRGHFTRYGDVAELLRQADDRQVILGSGDEMTVLFRVPDEEPPAGWVRDFIMHNVGWDKDADLNTVYGQTVEPLPYREMKSYPYDLEGQFPDSPAHREYLQRYQTRSLEVERFWNRVKLFPETSVAE